MKIFCNSIFPIYVGYCTYIPHRPHYGPPGGQIYTGTADTLCPIIRTVATEYIWRTCNTHP